MNNTELKSCPFCGGRYESGECRLIINGVYVNAEYEKIFNSVELKIPQECLVGEGVYEISNIPYVFSFENKMTGEVVRATKIKQYLHLVSLPIKTKYYHTYYPSQVK